MISPRYVVLTRDEQGIEAWRPAFLKAGLTIYALPCIEVQPKESKRPEILKAVSKSDWVVFTSANGVKAFMDMAASQKFPLANLPKIAAIGAATARALTNKEMRVDFLPSVATSVALARELPLVSEERITLLRSDIAPRDLPLALAQRQARVQDFSVYRTRTLTTPDPQFRQFAEAQQIWCVVFASPSAVRGFVAKAGNIALHLPAVALGKSTAQALQKHNFTDIHTLEPTLRNLTQYIAQRLL